MALFPAVPARAADPPLPGGQDSGGTAIAMFTAGIDYTEPEVARRLARDGEGELIGWDFVDGDSWPFGDQGGRAPASDGGDATALAMILAKAGGSRLVPVRVNPRDPKSLARAVAFVHETPARIVILPMWSASREDWQPFREAARRFEDILFITAAGDDSEETDGEPVYPAALGLDNVVVISARAGAQIRSGPRTGSEPGAVDAGVLSDRGTAKLAPADSREAAVLAVAAFLSCRGGVLQGLSGRDKKAEFLSKVAKPGPSAGRLVIEPCLR